MMRALIASALRPRDVGPEPGVDRPYGIDLAAAQDAEARLREDRAAYAVRVNVLEGLLDEVAQATEQTARELGHRHPAVTRIRTILEERAQ